MRDKQAGLRDRELNHEEHIKTKIGLEQELGRPICGFLVHGQPCKLHPIHPEQLQSGDVP